MELSEFLERLARTFEELSIPYLVTGSMATIAYGEPRFTNDIDVVVRLERRQVDELCAAFPEEEFHVDRVTVIESIDRRSQFNILHPASGLKVDVIVAEDTEFDRSRFSRTRRLKTAPEVVVSFASPEDVIVKKLQYCREGGSEKHLRDIAGVVKVVGEDLDRGYIERWVREMGLDEIWAAVDET
jgi:hypothetical protein